MRRIQRKQRKKKIHKNRYSKSISGFAIISYYLYITNLATMKCDICSQFFSMPSKIPRNKRMNEIKTDEMGNEKKNDNGEKKKIK